MGLRTQVQAGLHEVIMASLIGLQPDCEDLDLLLRAAMVRSNLHPTDALGAWALCMLWEWGPWRFSYPYMSQLLQIDTAGCMEVVRERKAQPPAPLQPDARGPPPRLPQVVGTGGKKQR
jgi:hypothetical protein